MARDRYARAPHGRQSRKRTQWRELRRRYLQFRAAEFREDGAGAVNFIILAAARILCLYASRFFSYEARVNIFKTIANKLTGPAAGGLLILSRALALAKEPFIDLTAPSSLNYDTQFLTVENLAACVGSWDEHFRQSTGKARSTIRGASDNLTCFGLILPTL